MGRVLIVLGLLIASLGVLMNLGLPLFRLPGDFVVGRGNVSFWFPLATSILLSVLVTLVLALFRR
jgi:hypothetical protein